MNTVSSEFGILYAESEDGTENNSFCITYNARFRQLPTQYNATTPHALIDFSNETGCSDIYNTSNSITGHTVAVSRGGCSFVQKAKIIQQHKGYATLLVDFSNNSHYTTPGAKESEYNEVNITIACILYNDFQNLKALGSRINTWFYAIQQTKADPNISMFFLISITCIVIGSYWSVSSSTSRYSISVGRRRRKPESGSDGSGQDATEDNDTMEITLPMAIVFVFVLCGMLVLLFFFYDYLIYVILVIFGLAGATGLYVCLSPLWMKIFHCDTHFMLCKWRLEWRGLGLATISLGFAVVWFVFRNWEYGWIFQDILGYAFCVNMLKTIRLPSLKVCTLLLGLLFIYDIFFVFITPLITSNGESVMVEVATGGKSKSGEQLPMVFKIPRFQNSGVSVCFQTPFSLLGFGDVMIPGLLVAHNHNFDMEVKSKWRIYFVATTIAYAVGLGATFVALTLMETGQPALLYLVPATLLTTFVLAWYRKEFRRIWSGCQCPKKNDDINPPRNPAPLRAPASEESLNADETQSLMSDNA